MNGSSIHLFRLFGIPIRIHVSWIIIFILITWSLATSYYPLEYEYWPSSTYWIVGAITSVLFFASVLLHELAHSLMALARGMQVRDIVLFVFGGVSEIADEPASPGTEFLMTLVGPLTSFFLSILAGIIWWTTRGLHQPLEAVSLYLARINLMLAIFNMLPGFPLDGGRLFRSIIWGITHDLNKATRWAVRLGVFIAWAFIFMGIMLLLQRQFQGMWLILIGWFLKTAAQNTYDRMRLKWALSNVPVRQVMTTQCERVSPDDTVGSVIQEKILTRGIRCLPVSKNGELLGLMTVHSAKEVPQARWNDVTVKDVMLPNDKVQFIGPEQDLWAAIDKMTGEGVNQLPVMQDGQLIGMLSRDAIMSFLKMRADLGI